MSIKQIKLKVGDLEPGMFVSGLDRPWTQTPFPIQGFLIRAPQDVDTLRAYCDYVYIDTTKGRSPSVETRVKAGVKGSQSRGTDSKTLMTYKPIKVERDTYRTETSLRQEMGNAGRVFNTLKGNLTLFTKQMARGRQVDYQGLRKSVSSMVDSVLRCPDAFTWLLRLRQQDQQTYDHSLRSALWAVQFGRFIGMAKEEIEQLCTGTLLKDIGKLRLPNELLHKKQRTSDEELEYRRFVEYGVEMLSNTHNVEAKVISVIKHHCERFDGSGFPQGLVGSKIPLLAQICGIATTYDAISNPRESQKPLAASRAISVIYDMRDRQFREDLVLQFIQSIGLYPTGTLVELTSGDVGVVLEQDPKSRLTPQIAVLPRNFKYKQSDTSYIIVDLKDEMETRRKLFEMGSYKARDIAKLAVARDLEPSRYDYDLNLISPELLKGQKDAGSSGGGWFKMLKNRFSSLSNR